MFRQTTPPVRLHTIAGLDEPSFRRRPPAVHQTRMAAMVAGQQLHHGGAFAVAAGGKHKCLIGPFHNAYSSGRAPQSSVVAQSPFAIAAGIVDPVLAHFDMNE